MNDNTLVFAKTMNSGQMSTDKFVPLAGEIIIDPYNNNCKIGDGITELCSLPWVALRTDITKNTHEELSERARNFIESNIEYIEANDYETLYSHITTIALAQEVTRALLKADLNPKPYLSKIPQSIKHILEPDDVWVEDTSRLYTKAEWESMMQYSQADLSMFDTWTNKLFAAMGIPNSIIKVGG